MICFFVKEKHTKRCLPPLFLTLNLTWGYTEVGRPELPTKMKGITQPLPEVIHAWLDSYEGMEWNEGQRGDFKGIGHYW